MAGRVDREKYERKCDDMRRACATMTDRLDAAGVSREGIEWYMVTKFGSTDLAGYKFGQLLDLWFHLRSLINDAHLIGKLDFKEAMDGCDIHLAR